MAFSRHFASLFTLLLHPACLALARPRTLALIFITVIIRPFGALPLPRRAPRGRRQGRRRSAPPTPLPDGSGTMQHPRAHAAGDAHGAGGALHVVGAALPQCGGGALHVVDAAREAHGAREALHVLGAARAANGAGGVEPRRQVLRVRLVRPVPLVLDGVQRARKALQVVVTASHAQRLRRALFVGRVVRAVAVAGARAAVRVSRRALVKAARDAHRTWRVQAVVGAARDADVAGGAVDVGHRARRGVHGPRVHQVARTRTPHVTHTIHLVHTAGRAHRPLDAAPAVIGAAQQKFDPPRVERHSCRRRRRRSSPPPECSSDSASLLLALVNFRVIAGVFCNAAIAAPQLQRSRGAPVAGVKGSLGWIASTAFASPSARLEGDSLSQDLLESRINGRLFPLWRGCVGGGATRGNLRDIYPIVLQFKHKHA